MNAYVIDSNLIFSAILNIKSGIGQFILKSNDYNLTFYAPKYLKSEITKHLYKILSISYLTEVEVNLLIDKIYDYISFIDDKIIPFDEYVKAMRIVRDIDPDDVTFVALANYMNLSLWTGDTKLYNGLKKIGFANVVNFDELKEIYKIK